MEEKFNENLSICEQLFLFKDCRDKPEMQQKIEKVFGSRKHLISTVVKLYTS